MRWYEQRFNNFFKKWKRGYLYTRGGASQYGIVKKLNLKQKFEESTIFFEPLDAKKRNAAGLEVSLKEIVYFRASDGPIFNVDKYISILQMQERSEGTIEASRAENKGNNKENNGDNKELVCVAFGLEFYANPQIAQALKSELNELIRSRLKDTPLVEVKEEKRVELTPSIDTFFRKIKARFKRGSTDAI